MEFDINKLSKSELTGAIIGMVLGDASLTNLDNGRRKNSCLRTGSIIEEYSKLKELVLKQITYTHINEEKRTGNSFGTKSMFVLSTKVHPIYTKLRMRFYKSGIKIIDPFLIKSLTNLGILFWYLDDGCLDDACGIKFQFHTCCFSYLEHLALTKLLNDKFGLRFNIRKSFKKEKGIIYYWLYLKACDRLEFFDSVIKPYSNYIPKEIMYKIPKREDIEKMMEHKSHKRFYENIV